MINVQRYIEETMLSKGSKHTEPGSLKYLLFGKQKSQQSIVIQMGHVGEYLFKEIINMTPKMTLLTCGVQVINEKGTKKDMDLVWEDKENKTIYYRELKANIELDTEKLPATINKINGISNEYLLNKPEYEGYRMDVGILNWSVYKREELSKGLSHIKKCEKKGVKVEHVGDILSLLKFEWSEEDFRKFWRKMGDLCNTIGD